MKTDDLIRALAQDAPNPKDTSLRRLVLAVPLALLVSMGLFFAFMGLRKGITTPDVAQAVLLKQGVTLALALAGLVLARRLAQPGQRAGAALALLAVPLAVLAVALLLDLRAHGLDHLTQRLFGANYWRCLLAIPLLSLPPLAAVLYALERGAVTDQSKAGIYAGLGAAGVAASLYALHCTDDSPLFIAAWYSLAAMLVAGAGRWGAARFLRW